MAAAPGATHAHPAFAHPPVRLAATHTRQMRTTAQATIDVTQDVAGDAYLNQALAAPRSSP